MTSLGFLIKAYEHSAKAAEIMLHWLNVRYLLSLKLNLATSYEHQNTPAQGNDAIMVLKSPRYFETYVA